MAGERIELLVHAGAPSTRHDDERYKAQAQAYTDFEGDRVSLESSSVGSSAVSGEPHSYIHEQTEIPCQKGASGADETTIAPFSPSVFVEDTQAAITALESQLVTSSLVIPEDSPSNRRATSVGDDTAAEASFDSRRTSTVSSHGPPLQSPVVRRPPKRPRRADWSDDSAAHDLRLNPPFVPIKENSHLALGYVGRSDGTEPRVSRGGYHEHESGDETQLGGCRTARSSDPRTPSQNTILNNFGDDINIDSELPTSYSLSDITSKTSKEKSQASHASQVQFGVSPEPQNAAAVSPCEDVVTTLSNVPRSTHDAVPDEPASLSVTVPTPLKSIAAPAALDSSDATQTRLTAVAQILPSSVHPPPPLTSLKPYETHITDSLAFLANRSDLSACYKPVFISRELRSSERGHWLLNTKSWPLQLKTEFWNFLQKFVGDGNVGWGVWCTREPQADEQGLGVVKVFCWGEIVKHLYLVLYVASKSKVRRAGIKWIDAEEKVVVQMREG